MSISGNVYKVKEFENNKQICNTFNHKLEVIVKVLEDIGISKLKDIKREVVI